MTSLGKLILFITLFILLGTGLFVMSRFTVKEGNSVVIPPTQPLHTDPAKQEMFEKLLSEYGLSITEVTGKAHWSPDNNYVLFQGQTPAMRPNQLETATAIGLIDFKKGTITEIYQGGYLMGDASWSDDHVVFVADGIYLYNLETGEMAVVAGGGRAALLSPNGEQVIYRDQGMKLYSILDKTTTVLTSKEDDIPAAWFGDNEHVLYFRNDGTRLGDGAGYRQIPSVFSITDKTYKDLLSAKAGKYQSASWVRNNELLFVRGGFDDGISYSLINVKNDTTHLIWEGGVDMSVSVDVSNDKTVMIAEDEKIKFYDEEMKEIGSYIITAIDSDPVHYWSHTVLPDGTILVLGRKEGGGSRVLTIDPKRGTQIVTIPSIQNPRFMDVSPDGKVVLLAPEGTRFQFQNL